jgi:SAM-dependent methyltransferase
LPGALNSAEFLGRVVRCRQCELCFTNPRPSAESMGPFYAADYSPHQRCGLTPGQRRRARWWALLPRAWRAGNPERRGWPRPRPARLLDVGCGGGAFLERMRLQGWEVTGLDASAAIVARVRRELGLPILLGSLPRPDLTPQSFELVTLWQSLEHLPRPLEALSDARRLLAPGGRLMVSVPNIASGPYRWFGSAWFGLDLPRHLLHFTPATLRAMLHRAGFAIDSLGMIPHSDWLRASAGLARRQRPSLGRLGWLGLRGPSRLAAWYCWITRQSDCLLAIARKEG